jgi:hypothetical protein
MPKETRRAVSDSEKRPLNEGAVDRQPERVEKGYRPKEQITNVVPPRGAGTAETQLTVNKPKETGK